MVKVRLFASLKDVAGRSTIELPLPSQVTVDEVYSALLSEHPELERYRSILLAAVNEEYANWETLVGPDDEVAFFPPVSGGHS